MSLTVAFENDLVRVSRPSYGLLVALETHFEGEDVCCISLEVLKGYRADYYEDHKPGQEERLLIDAFIADAEAHWTRRDCLEEWYMVMFRRTDDEGDVQIHFADPLRHVRSPGWDFFERHISLHIESSDPVTEISLSALRECARDYRTEDRPSAAALGCVEEFLADVAAHWKDKKLEQNARLMLWADLPVA